MLLLNTLMVGSKSSTSMNLECFSFSLVGGKVENEKHVKPPFIPSLSLDLWYSLNILSAITNGRLECM